MKTDPVVVFFRSTIGDAPETVTSSVSAPSSSFWSMPALKPVSITTSGRVTFLKPLISNVTVNLPMGTLGN